MTHDSRRSGCHTSKTDHFLYLMQSQLMAVSPLMKWSNCSKRAITEFIEYVKKYNTCDVNLYILLDMILIMSKRVA